MRLACSERRAFGVFGAGTWDTLCMGAVACLADPFRARPMRRPAA